MRRNNPPPRGIRPMTVRPKHETSRSAHSGAICRHPAAMTSQLVPTAPHHRSRGIPGRSCYGDQVELVAIKAPVTTQCAPWPRHPPASVDPASPVSISVVSLVARTLVPPPPGPIAPPDSHIRPISLPPSFLVFRASSPLIPLLPSSHHQGSLSFSSRRSYSLR